MRIACWVSLILLTGVAAAADHKLDLPSGKTLTYSSSAGCTKVVVPMRSRSSSVCLQRDDTTAPDAQPASVKLIAEVPETALILTDTYSSIPGGMSYCQAGQEVFLRVISLRGKHAKETYHQKLGSCRQNIELADPGVTWSSDSKSLTLHWISGPAHQGSEETRTLLLESDGEIKQQ